MRAKIMIWFFSILAVLVMVGLLVAILTAYPARSHSWYEWQCCHEQDCKPLAEPPVKVKGGYRTPDGRFFPMSVLRESRDNRWHACVRGGKSQCLYAPLAG